MEVRKFFILASYSGSIIEFRGDLIKKLIRRGFQVHVAAPEISENTEKILFEWGCVVHHIFLKRTGKNPFHDIKTFICLVRMFLKVSPDFLLSYTIKPVVYGNLAGFFSGVSRRFSFITGVGSNFISEGNFRKKFLKGTIFFLYKIALKLSEKIIFQNKDDLELFLGKNLVDSGKCFIVNGSGVNTQRYGFTPMHFGEEIVFLMISRLLRDKGVIEYVEAAERLKTEGLNASFWLAGWFDNNPSSILSSELQMWIEKGFVKFLGRLDDVRPIIAKCNVFVLPSYREGTPRTVLEAEAMGRPVITTDAPGCRETVVSGRNGYLVPVGNSGKLADAMRIFIEKPEICNDMGEASRKYVEKKYDVEIVNNDLFKIFGIEN